MLAVRWESAASGLRRLMHPSRRRSLSLVDRKLWEPCFFFSFKILALAFQVTRRWLSAVASGQAPSEATIRSKWLSKSAVTETSVKGSCWLGWWETRAQLASQAAPPCLALIFSDGIKVKEMLQNTHAAGRPENGGLRAAALQPQRVEHLTPPSVKASSFT